MNFHSHVTRMRLLTLVAGLVVTREGAAQINRPSDAEVQSNVIKALTLAPDLASAQISTTIQSGVVTLSGTVFSDGQRKHADQVTSTTFGVRRVIDQMAVSNGSPSSDVQASTAVSDIPRGGVLQSDGTYAVSTTSEGSSSTYAQPVEEVHSQNSTSSLGRSGTDEVPPPNGPGTDAYGQPLSGPPSVAPEVGSSSSAQSIYPNAQPTYGQSPTNRTHPDPYGQTRPMYAQNPNGPGSGQPGGLVVTLPSGTVLRVRVNQHLSSRDVGVGAQFDAVVINDVVANGLIAIPKGTYLQGTVVEAEHAGRLKGSGELGLKLSQMTLGGEKFSISSDVFSAHGGDKTIQTVNSAVGLGALGAIFGAVAGGGVGAAVGAGAGGALGLGASAASERGDVFIPSEAVLSFRLNQPLEVTTVSQAEMQRLALGVPGEGRPRIIRRDYYPYYGPVAPRYYYRTNGYYPY